MKQPRPGGGGGVRILIAAVASSAAWCPGWVHATECTGSVAGLAPGAAANVTRTAEEEVFEFESKLHIPLVNLSLAGHQPLVAGTGTGADPLLAQVLALFRTEIGVAAAGLLRGGGPRTPTAAVWTRWLWCSATPTASARRPWWVWLHGA